MSDTEQEWKPNPRRPQSTMAQAFSLALDSAFMLDNDVNDLTQSIELKKQRMTIQTRELEALQARIREAEERLQQEKEAANDSAAKHGDNSTLHGMNSARQDGRDSDTSAATSHDMYEQEDDGKGKPHAS